MTSDGETVAGGSTPFEVVVERNGEVGLMRLTGELDFEHHQKVIDCIHGPELKGVDQWAIDCSDLTFVDSGGLRAILAVAGSVGGLPGIALYEPRPQLISLLKAAGLFNAVTIRPAEDLEF